MKKILAVCLLSISSLANSSELYINSTFDGQSFNYSLEKNESNYKFYYNTTKGGYSIGHDFLYGGVPVLGEYGIKPLVGVAYYADGNLTDLKDESIILPIGIKMEYKTEKRLLNRNLGFNFYYKTMPEMLSVGEVKNFSEYAFMVSLKPERGLFYELGFKSHEYISDFKEDKESSFISFTVGVTY